MYSSREMLHCFFCGTFCPHSTPWPTWGSGEKRSWGHPGVGKTQGVLWVSGGCSSGADHGAMSGRGLGEQSWPHRGSTCRSRLLPSPVPASERPCSSGFLAKVPLIATQASFCRLGRIQSLHNKSVLRNMTYSAPSLPVSTPVGCRQTWALWGVLRPFCGLQHQGHQPLA